MTLRIAAAAIVLAVTACSAEPDPVKEASQDPAAVLANAAFLLHHFEALEAAGIPGVNTSEEFHFGTMRSKIVIGPYIMSPACGNAVYMATERTLFGRFDTDTGSVCRSPKLVRILSANGADGARWIEQGPWNADLPARLAAYRKALEAWQDGRVRRAAELLK